MKKYGRKWRMQNNNLNVPITPKRDLTKEQREKEVRQNPWTPQDIEAKRIKAKSILKKANESEKWAHERHEQELKEFKKLISEGTFISIWRKIHYHLNEDEPLGEWLRYYYISFIEDINSIFEIAKKEHTAKQIFEHLTAGKYDLEKGSLKEFGKRYIDVVCEITEGSTWRIRKDTMKILHDLYEKFDLTNITN